MAASKRADRVSVRASKDVGDEGTLPASLRNRRAAPRTSRPDCARSPLAPAWRVCRPDSSGIRGLGRRDFYEPAPRRWLICLHLAPRRSRARPKGLRTRHSSISWKSHSRPVKPLIFSARSGLKSQGSRMSFRSALRQDECLRRDLRVRGDRR